MNFFLTKRPYPNTKLLWAVQIFLLTLIVIGITLLFTQKLWLPKVVGYLLTKEGIVVLNTVAKGERVEDFDLKNAVLMIEGMSVSLVDGASEMLVTPGSAEKVVTRYFGNEAIGDMNGDKKPDVVFLVTQETGGSALFYYAVVALTGDDGYFATNAVLLGDRISPQTTTLDSVSREIQINYAERLPEEPMTTPPSVAVTAILKVNEYGGLEKL
jgi:hypothetical protein